ncbi:MAG: hypothetical protein RBR65_05425 [Aliarcobacter sp.]|jgi:hypothetical protein|nr:hypothetical protein [Aliarcobacter sp.]
MYKKILNIILIILVFIYIIFEELVWEKFAKPIINFISKLQLFTKIIPKILALNSYIILIFFVGTFLIVELIGIYAGLLFVSGNVTSAILIYVLKVPVAAFIFWFFSIVKYKLLEFKWFEVTYNYLMLIISKIKNSLIYTMIKEKAYELKKSIKEKFFSTRNKFKKKAVYIYKLLKQKIKF